MPRACGQSASLRPPLDVDAKPESFDLIVVGGGLNGLCLLLALQETPLKVAWVDQVPWNFETTEALDNRGLALSATSLEILRHLQVHSALAPHWHPIQCVHVSQKGSFGAVRLNASDQGVSALGAVIGMDRLLAVLKQQLRSNAHQKGYCPYRPKTIHCTKAEVILDLQPLSESLFPVRISAPLLVACDGTESHIRSHFKIPVHVHDYAEQAIIANVQTQLHHEQRAYERLTSEGILAFLPFGNHRVKCVWTLPNEQANHQKSQPDVLFLRSLENLFGDRLGRLQSISKRIHFPLKQVRVQRLHAHRTVLIGNAANTLHPVAAQGFNLGLRDVAFLAEVLVAAHRAGQDLGSETVLQAYADRRINDHEAIATATHRLANWFKTTHAFQQWIQASVWAGLEAVSPLKRWIADQGMGRAGLLPKLALGVPL